MDELRGARTPISRFCFKDVPKAVIFNFDNRVSGGWALGAVAEILYRKLRASR
jgi:hypothetical protein